MATRQRSLDGSDMSWGKEARGRGEDSPTEGERLSSEAITGGD